MTRTGRPPKPETRRDVLFRLRLRQAERTELNALADLFGETPSQLLRRLIAEAKEHVR